MKTNKRAAFGAFDWLCVVLLAAFGLQWLGVPFWGDDYHFLLQQRESAAGWLGALLPDRPDKFWRPLGEDGYWWVIVRLFGGNALAAHGANLLLWLMASLAVGWALFEATNRTALRSAWLGAVLYALHGMHLLPLAWASAANNSIMMVFAASALAMLTVAVRANRTIWFVASCLALVGAFLSREAALVLPLVAPLWIYAIGLRINRQGVLFIAVWFVLVILWWGLRSSVVVADDPSYQPGVGWHSLRNGAAMLAYVLNVPREAFRLLVGQSLWGWGWVVITASLQWVVIILLWRGSALPRRRQAALLALVAVAMSPFVLVPQFAYGYYLSISLLALAYLGTRAAQQSAMQFVVLLAAGSGLLATLPNHFLAHPNLIGRAKWAEAVLSELQDYEPRPERVAVTFDDPQRYYAIGHAGIAWRLGLPRAAVDTGDKANLVVSLHGDQVAISRGDVSESPSR